MVGREEEGEGKEARAEQCEKFESESEGKGGRVSARENVDQSRKEKHTLEL